MVRQALLAPDRAPRLRRLATLLEDRAEDSRSPQSVRALACRMRLRATELEAGDELTGDDEALRLLSELFDEADEA